MLEGVPFRGRESVKIIYVFPIYSAFLSPLKLLHHAVMPHCRHLGARAVQT